MKHHAMEMNEGLKKQFHAHDGGYQLTLYLDALSPGENLAVPNGVWTP